VHWCCSTLVKLPSRDGACDVVGQISVASHCVCLGRRYVLQVLAGNNCGPQATESKFCVCGIVGHLCRHATDSERYRPRLCCGTSRVAPPLLSPSPSFPHQHTVGWIWQNLVPDLLKAEIAMLKSLDDDAADEEDEEEEEDDEDDEDDDEGIPIGLDGGVDGYAAPRSCAVLCCTVLCVRS
jgi:hypothetical protein